MSTQVKFRRGTAVEHETFTGAVGEITIDTTNDAVVVHNGVTPGGHRLPNADQRKDYEGWSKALFTATGIPEPTVPDTELDSKKLQALIALEKPISAINTTDYADKILRLKQIVGGSGPVGISTRDPFLVSRELTGQTDCHAFADITKISNATDSGTYGTFDSTTEIAGSHSQSHQFSFQDRAKFSGSGSLGSWGNIIWPSMTGEGAVTNRYDLWVKDIAKTGGGTVGTHIGIFMENFTHANSNSAFTTLQSTGYSVYAPNGAACVFGGTAEIKGTATLRGTTLLEGTTYLGGNTKVGGYTNGTPPLVGVALTVEKNGVVGQGFVDQNSLGLSIGVIGDKKLQLVTNSVTRWTVSDSAGSYALLPANTSPDIGSSAFRVGTLFAVNAINTSDIREKQQERKLTELERKVALEIKESMRGYKWNHAVTTKGDENARWHFGVLAQTVHSIFEANGLDGFKYGVLCYDEWEDKYEDVQINKGEKTSKTVVTTFEREQQKYKIVQELGYVKDLTVVDGQTVYVLRETLVDKMVYEFKEYPVVDEEGNIVKQENGEPVIEREAVMETIVDTAENTYETDADPVYESRLVEKAGNRYGVNYNDLFSFIIMGT